MTSANMKFKGLMAPVFTAFNNDETQSVNYDIIDQYAAFLKKNQVHGVLVNGTSGEGMSMTVDERKKTAEKWSVACNKYDLSLMVQIGGNLPFVEVANLAAHAESLKVDSILCLAELYFKPKTEESLAQYLSDVSKYCRNTPLLYYHIPMFTGINLHMSKFIEIASKRIPNFAGIKYTSGDMEIGVACLKSNKSIFLGADTLLSGALAMGFDSTIMTSLNICPELSIQIVGLLKHGKVLEANEVQLKLSERVGEILKIGGGDWVPSMKAAFNRLPLEIKVGDVRKPLH